MSAFVPQPRRPSPGPVPSTGVGPMPEWGWLEWFAIGQTALPALMFIPGLSAVRTPSRIAAFAWVVSTSGPDVTRRFSALDADRLARANLKPKARPRPGPVAT